MLGVRLDAETERGLEKIARRTKRPKSQIAREAIRRYVERNDIDAVAQDQWARISAAERSDTELGEGLDWALAQIDPDAAP